MFSFGQFWSISINRKFFCYVSENIFSNLKVFMEQQKHSFSDSTPRVGSDRLQKSSKSLLCALQIMSISQISTQKYGSGHFDPFWIARKFRPIGERLRNHADKSEHFLRILELYFCLLHKNEIIFSHFSFDFVTNYYQSNYVLINNHL